jgi:hypothetical protein
MKYLSVALLLVVGIIGVAIGQPPTVPANDGATFGAGTTAETRSQLINFHNY